MARNSASGKRNRSTKIVAALGAVVVVVSVALPRLMNTEGLDADGPPKPRKRLTEEEAAELAQRFERPPVETAVAIDVAARPRKHDGPAERVDMERVERAADDLEVVLGLRWESYPAGTAIQARVEIANRDERPVWIPSFDEPQRTLALRVLDEKGATVRHVVEESADRVPRRMRRLGPGESMTITLDVLAHGEKPLPVGHYELAAVYEADKAWLRTGLPVWTAPKGERHSDRVPFEVTER